MAELFEFRECVSILKSTGRSAIDLQGLRQTAAEISDRSIYHHTYQYFQKERFLEYTNDFAHWAGECLEERVLSEHLSNIDPYEFKDIAGLRGAVTGVIDEFLKAFPAPRNALPGSEFYFNETVTLILPVGLRVKNLAEFLMAMKYLDAGSIYYHFYEARTRLESMADDFSHWFEDALGKKELADKIRAIDPFMHDIDGIRAIILDAAEAEVKKDMEIAHI